MGSLSGILQRPILAASAVAIASITSDFRDKFWPSKPLGRYSSLEQSYSSDSLDEQNSSWVSMVSVSKLADFSFVARICVPVPNVDNRILISSFSSVTSFRFSSLAASPVLISSYQSAELVKSARPALYNYEVTYPASEVLYTWHLPELNAVDVSDSSECSLVKSRTVVVLLGWLGAKQKHLNRYAEWYTSRGFHAITFTLPMSEILSYQVGGKLNRI